MFRVHDELELILNIKYYNLTTQLTSFVDANHLSYESSEPRDTSYPLYWLKAMIIVFIFSVINLK